MKKTTCLICGKEVEEPDLMPNGEPDRINGAVIGEQIEVQGHRTCVQNVNQIVVIQNRMGFNNLAMN